MTACLGAYGGISGGIPAGVSACAGAYLDRHIGLPKIDVSPEVYQKALIESLTSKSRSSHPITCGNVSPTPNPFFFSKVDELGTGVILPGSPLYCKSPEERIEDRRLADEHMKRIQQTDMERTGLADLGYTHNGLGPVPPLFVDTDVIRGKGKEVPEYLRLMTVTDYKAMDEAVRQARGQRVLPHFKTVQTPTKESPIEVLRRYNPILHGEEELIRYVPLGIQEHIGPTGLGMRNVKPKEQFFRVYPTGGGIEHYRSPDGSIDIPRLIKEGSVDLSKL